MIYASVCDGIGAAHAAWKPLGWRCAWTSEIEPFPIAVVDHHYGLPNLGDMTKITEADVEKHGRIDLLVGGTPCQSFSVAGLRGGMADPRGNLALRFLQLAGTLRPTWVVWENVPGVLSSNEGRDFGAFLGALGQLGYGWAYRVLDARYFGVPQRRRRPFVVGYLGDWRRAASVLLERESMCGHPPPCGEAGEGTAEGAARSLRGRSNASHREDSDTYIPSEALCLNAGGTGRIDGESETFIPVTVGPLMHGKRSAGSVTLQDVYSGHAIPVAHALRADGHDASEEGTGRGTPLVALAIRTAQTSANGHGIAENLAHTLDGASQAVAFAQNQRDEVREMDSVGALASEPGMKQQSYIRHHGVRRITPLEAERLQGFPDHYTAIRYRGKPAADAPRYKALGNSMAVPCMAWIGNRIATTSLPSPPQCKEGGRQ